MAVCSYAPLRADDHGHNFARQFTAANGSLATGAAINQNDNLRMEARVRYDGPSANGGILIGKGSGCCNGWGVLMYGTVDGAKAGTLAILAGGVTIADLPQPMRLPLGEWQRIRVESRGQRITVSFPGKHNPGPQFSYGIVPRNNLNATSSVTIGQGFNGLIDDVEFTALGTPNSLLEFWDFDRPQPSSTMVTGAKGGILDLTNVNVVRLPDDNDGDHDHGRGRR